MKQPVKVRVIPIKLHVDVTTSTTARKKRPKRPKLEGSKANAFHRKEAFRKLSGSRYFGERF